VESRTWEIADGMRRQMQGKDVDEGLFESFVKFWREIWKLLEVIANQAR
jgi:hypothetical protein